jgi:8-oxo-dGTP diphosphatase
MMKSEFQPKETQSEPTIDPALQPFFKMAFSVDSVIFGFDGRSLKVLLIRRGEDPYKDYWALPGNLVYLDEDIDHAAERVLYELTGLRNVYLQQVETFGALDRHPVGRVITTAYYSLIKIDDAKVSSQSHVQEVKWFPIHDVGLLAFDHNKILNACFKKLQRMVRNQPLGFELLPPKFTLSALQRLYEAVLEVSLDKRNFRKKILSMKLLVDMNESQEGVSHRPARLYRFDENRYRQLLEDGFSFEL